MMTNDVILTIAKAQLRGISKDETPYVDRADVVAWLRKCALESGDTIPGRTAAELANALERMDVEST